MIQEIHENDVGTVFRIILKAGKKVVDISGANYISIFFQKQDGTVEEKIAVFTTDGTDGSLEYIAQVGFLDQSGEEWFQQAFIKMDGGEWRSNIEKFTVYPNI